MTPDEQVAAIRERLAAGDYRLTQVPEIHTLLNRIDELTAERDAIERDSDILLGAEWRRSVQAVNGDPEAAREHRIAALVADLAEANERRAETVAMCELLAAERDEAEANIGEVNQLLADTLSRTKSAEQHVERLTAELAAANARADGERAKLLSLAEDLANGYDHEADAHRYDNGACRTCKGQEILREYTIEAVEAKGGGDG